MKPHYGVNHTDVEPALIELRRWAKRHHYWVRYVALLGSVREGEAIRGYSDLDLLLILTSDRRGSMPDRCVASMRRLSTRLTARSPLPVSLLPHTWHDLRGYVDPSYLLHYARAEVIVGSAQEFDRSFKMLLKRSGLSNQVLRPLCRHNILHARFNMVRKYVSAGERSDEAQVTALGKALVDWVLEVADWALLSCGVAISGKVMLAAAFREHFSELRTVDVPAAAVRLRARWPSVTLSEIIRFQYRAIAFVREVAARFA